jgi:succinyl-diaminopimelate desuccinylase
MTSGAGRLTESVPTASIEKLACELVSIPSQAGIDSTEPILRHMAAWLEGHDLPALVLADREGTEVALATKYVADPSGPSICFNACLDTAPFGDENSWSFSPIDGTVLDKRLRGRGSADSKIGASIIAHVVNTIVTHKLLDAGTIHLLFDADEHTGHFGGVRSFIERTSLKPQAVVLSYPGNDKLVIGARGFYRARITVFGKAAHSGATTRRGVNAIEKLAELVSMLKIAPLPAATDDFPLPPVATVSEIHGGRGFSQIPDKATCNVDVRITPSFDGGEASAWLHELVARVDMKIPSPAKSIVELDQTWPAYAVDVNSRLVTCFLTEGRVAFNRPIMPEICGPSNIGNFLASYGIPTICGLGVSYENIHGADESSDVTSIPSSFRSYLAGALNFLAPS